MPYTIIIFCRRIFSDHFYTC